MSAHCTDFLIFYNRINTFLNAAFAKERMYFCANIPSKKIFTVFIAILIEGKG